MSWTVETVAWLLTRRTRERAYATHQAYPNAVLAWRASDSAYCISVCIHNEKYKNISESIVTDSSIIGPSEEWAGIKRPATLVDLTAHWSVSLLSELSHYSLFCLTPHWSVSLPTALTQMFQCSLVFLITHLLLVGLSTYSLSLLCLNVSLLAGLFHCSLVCLIAHWSVSLLTDPYHYSLVCLTPHSLVSLPNVLSHCCLTDYSSVSLLIGLSHSSLTCLTGLFHWSLVCLTTHWSFSLLTDLTDSSLVCLVIQSYVSLITGLVSLLSERSKSVVIGVCVFVTHELRFTPHLPPQQPRFEAATFRTYSVGTSKWFC